MVIYAYESGPPKICSSLVVTLEMFEHSYSKCLCYGQQATLFLMYGQFSELSLFMERIASYITKTIL
jgi:hypothetical protein